MKKVVAYEKRMYFLCNFWVSRFFLRLFIIKQVSGNLANATQILKIHASAEKISLVTRESLSYQKRLKH